MSDSLSLAGHGPRAPLARFLSPLLGLTVALLAVAGYGWAENLLVFGVWGMLVLCVAVVGGYDERNPADRCFARSVTWADVRPHWVCGAGVTALCAARGRFITAGAGLLILVLLRVLLALGDRARASAFPHRGT